MLEHEYRNLNSSFQLFNLYANSESDKIIKMMTNRVHCPDDITKKPKEKSVNNLQK